MKLPFKIDSAFYIKVGKIVVFSIAGLISTNWAWPYIDKYFEAKRQKQNMEIVRQIEAAQNASKYEIIKYIDNRVNLMENSINTRLDNTNSVLRNHIIKSSANQDEIINAVDKLYQLSAQKKNSIPNPQFWTQLNAN